MPHISYLDTAAPKSVEGAKIKIEIESHEDKRKTEMRTGTIIQRTTDIIAVEFPCKCRTGSFKESFRLMDLAAGLIKWEVLG